MNNSWVIHRALTEWLAQGLVSSVSGVQVAVSPQGLSATRAAITLHRSGTLVAIVDVHATLASAVAGPPAGDAACLVTAASDRGLYRLVSGTLTIQTAYGVSAAIGDAIASLVSGVVSAAEKASGAAQADDLHAVATSGQYADLAGKPTLGTAAAASASNFATSAQGGKADSAVQPAALAEAVAAEATRASSVEAMIAARLHPGDVPGAFGTGLTGAVTASPAYTAASVATDSSLGASILLTGDAYVAPRAPIPIEPGRVYLIRWAARRKTAPADPLSDAVVYGVQWLTPSLTSAGSTTHATLPLLVADGAVRRTMTASLDVAGADVTIPASARQCRPWIHTYGTHETYVGIVDLIDITEAYVEASAREAADNSFSDDISEINGILNKYFVTFYGTETRPTVDVANGIVKYGRMAITRNGQSWKDVNPANYSLSNFTAPLSPVGGTSAYYHYIDVSVIGAENPVKSTSGATVPILTKDIVPLGVSLDGVYQSFWSGDAESTVRPLEMRSISMEAAIIIDRNNRLGGGTAVYVPRQIYVNAPLSGVTISTFVANAASSELSTHVKFVLPSSAPTNACSIYLDVETSQYSLATYPTLPAGSGRGFVPVATVWKDSHTAFNGVHCIDSIDYDIQLMRDRLWSCAITTKQAIIWDRSNFYGGGAEAIYIPMAIYIRHGSKEVKVTSGFGNPESSELLGYMKVTGVGSSTVHALIFTASTKTFEIRTYGSDLDLDPEKLSDVYVLATIWVGTWTGIDHVNTNYGVESNQTPFGKSHIDEMPHFFGTTTIQDVTEENLLALGFTKGAADITSANRPFFGDDFKEYIRGGWIHIKFWVQTDTANNFGNPDVYFWTGVGGSYLDLKSSNVKKVKSLSNYAAQYEYKGRLPSDVDYAFFYVGTSTQSTSIHTVITGVQYAVTRNVFFNILDTDFPDPSADVTEQAFAARDAANIGLSGSYADRVIVNVQRPTADINVKFVTGQSLARGHQTQFALSGVALYGNKMLGGNVLPTADDGETYPTFSPGDNWQDLIAIPEINGTVYTNATSPDGAFGEPWNFGWLNFGKHLFNQMRLVDNDARTFATFNTSVSGKTIEQLSKVNTQDSVDRFSRLTDALDRAVSASSGSSAVVSSVMFGQGEYDYSAANGSMNRTRELYKAALNTYFTDIKAEIMARVPDQKLGPAFFTYVTGASYTVDTDANGDPDLFVAMAQLELSDERDDLWVVGPIYPYTDKGGHLTANGSRWYGNLLAKVEHRVQHLGQDWGPVRPTRIQLINSEIYIDYHVPEPPLDWRSVYVGQTLTMYPNKGFRVIDRGNSNANVSISSVDLVGSTIVRITLTGNFSKSLSVYYADKLVHNGNGNLCDSDRTIAHDIYVYDASFMPETENHTELVGKPYPLNNWCVPFFLPIGYGL